MGMPNHVDDRLLIIDCADKHHPLLRRWSRQRCDAYRNAGWTISGETVQSPLDTFLDSRPEVHR